MFDMAEIVLDDERTAVKVRRNSGKRLDFQQINRFSGCVGKKTQWIDYPLVAAWALQE